MAPHPVDPLQQVIALYHARRYAEARAAAARLLQRQADHVEAMHLSALCLLGMGQAVQAEYFAARAAAAAPNRPDIQSTHAMTLSAAGKTEAAVALFERVANGTPADPVGWANLGRALLGAQRVKEGVAAFQRALERDPRHGPSLRELGLFHRLCGRADLAAPLLARAVQLAPGDVESACNHAMTLNYVAGAEPVEVLAAHARAARAMSVATGIAPSPRRAAHAPAGALRVGYLSPDFRSHSVASFFEPLLVNRERAAHAALLYMTAPKTDAVSDRLRDAADGWLEVAGLSDTELALRLRADRLDVLIDLAGLTRGSRIGVLARRPAPLQGTYLGYPSTTGAAGVDFRIVDGITDTPEADGWHSEKLVRLERCFLAYQPPAAADAPEPALPPEGAPVTFGSFNLFMKISPAAARAWGRILDGVPGSRLLLKTIGLDAPAVRAVFVETLRNAGLDTERVDFLPFAPTRRAHLETYTRLHVALDPFPYCGTATTCEALFMGVPVVTLRGRMHAERVGASLLTAMGGPAAGWVAHSEDEYVRKAVALAEDRTGLRGLRTGIRPALLTSPLCDGAALARAFEGAVRGLVAGGT